MAKSVMVLGSKGYVGGRLVERFSSQNLDVTSVDRISRDDFFLFTLVDGKKKQTLDIREKEFGEAIANTEFIVNCAANVSKEQDPRSAAELVVANSMISAVLGSQSSNVPAKIIHLGTYSHKTEYSQAQTFYAATKKAGEDFLQYLSADSTSSVTVLHLYDLYGPNQPHNRLIPALIDALVNKTKFSLSKGEQDFRPLFIVDLEMLLLEIINEWRGPMFKSFQIYDVYGPETHKVKEIPMHVARALGDDWQTGQLDFTLPYRTREIMKFNPCHDLAPYRGPWTRLNSGLRAVISTRTGVGDYPNQMENEA